MIEAILFCLKVFGALCVIGAIVTFIAGAFIED
jgi:hypothetical protein